VIVLYGHPMKDFTKARPDLSFKIDDDVFQAVPSIPGKVMLAVGNKMTSLNEGEMPDASLFDEVLDVLLEDESAERFKARMNDKARPIDMDQFNQVMQWIMGEHGLRPTEQSGPSSPGSDSPDSGTSSTESTLVAVSTLETSPQIAS
jgi:hypothetical protein